MAFTGQFSECTKCNLCGLPRYKYEATKTPFKTFSYIPLIPQLRAAFSNPELVKSMQYRANYFTDEGASRAGVVGDIFDGEDYQELLRTPVGLVGDRAGEFFFAGDTDIALGLSSDGFAPFKSRKQSAWPLILFNYNLPPEIRFWIENIICVGVIPGPKAVKDIDSFLWGAIEELLQLAAGIRTLNSASESSSTFARISSRALAICRLWRSS